MKIYCEKCNSTDIEIVNIAPRALEEQKVSIKDYQGPSIVINAVYTLTTDLITCKNCGNYKKITY